jgi:uncharacterized protein (DUF1499 family)
MTLPLLVAALAALLLLVAGPGVRLDLWSFRTGFDLLKWAAYLGLAGAALGVVQLVVPRWRLGHVRGLVLAVVLGLAVAGVPWYWRRLANQVPPIHDISTDTADPPAFVAVLPLRAGAANPAEYGGPEIASQQASAYPDIRTLELPTTPPGVAFTRARHAVRASGWELVAADSTDGRVEATATTGWFGFKDDVVVRVRPAGSGSRVDVRSVSRVGKSDVGTNARRIRAFLSRLRAS